MRRLATLFLVALLVLSASGVMAISWTDPCEGETESARSGDQNCPPTCFTCACCHQAIEPPLVGLLPTVEPVTQSLPQLSPLPGSSEPRGILHVPKRVA